MFSEWMRDEIARRRMSERKLASLCGLSQSTINRIKHGTLLPTRDMCVALADAFGLDRIFVQKQAGYNDADNVPSDRIAYEIMREVETLDENKRAHVLEIVRMIKDGTLTSYRADRDERSRNA